jgi:hypothetical protein
MDALRHKHFCVAAIGESTVLVSRQFKVQLQCNYSTYNVRTYIHCITNREHVESL